MTEIELIPYIPITGSYEITYPKNFHLEENDNGIVTITSLNNYSNLTISGYQSSSDVDEKVLIDFFTELTEDYTPISEISKEISRKRFYVERKFKRDKTHWIWWGVVEKNQLVMISVNSESELSSDDYNLYKFMIDEMKVYPSEYKD